ncbi:threonine/homoserine/homoserine lactone efflux protein [Rhodopseudomonas julia]|uniref:Threonine/homoserine/homoserine lactone efflux protein n=1 Tax=Rhodopseudomonas julia TaxID=200617 RepID=A0ABU0C5T6_9BRAD|nr:LysE family transporter [Rhodopseudomonas julia]MDQ0325855.1 threonine/homoserine/homoserine lactone efflux protein [Rhodopseudomonas julia]
MIDDALWQYLPNLLVILSIFTVGVASPGPATLMILGTAMASGRASAVALSCGVVLGSMFWASIAALGFAAAFKASATLFMALKLAGGFYLIFLAAKSLRSALTQKTCAAPMSAGTRSLGRCFSQGLLLHLTNPKAPLVWLATLSVGVGEDAPAAFLVIAVLLCAFVAMAVFVGYAFLFSTRTASRIYVSIRRPMDGLLGILFGAAALKILTYRLN